MFDFFDSFFMVFGILFMIVFILVVSFIINGIVKGAAHAKNRGRQEGIPEEAHAVIKEKEIIKEIVKIRCPYCNNLYNEKEDKCPHCGGKNA